MLPLPVEILENVSLQKILDKIKERKPVLIKKWDVGPCVRTWTYKYICSKVGEEPVKIHVSQNGKMNFISKNFLYKTIPFDELIKRIFCVSKNDHFIHPEEFYYLRSLGNDPRGKDVANFLTQFPDLAEDFKIPPFFDKKDFFSSIFRASSKGLQLWTHFDVMDNILTQITGTKRIILWPPSEIDNMYLIGDKSQVLEVDDPDPKKYPKFIKAVRYECVMNPGDVVYIPALWFHNTIALEPSLAVNIFWKNLSHELYDKNDTYGNKDILIGAKGLQAVTAAVKSLSILPEEYKNFYIQRMIKVLQESLDH